MSVPLGVSENKTDSVRLVGLSATLPVPPKFPCPPDWFPNAYLFESLNTAEKLVGETGVTVPSELSIITSCGDADCVEVYSSVFEPPALSATYVLT